MFEKHASQMSGIFWESMETFIQSRGHLLLEPVTLEYLVTRARMLSEAVSTKRGTLRSCVGFSYGTALGVTRPSGHMQQIVVQNGNN